MTAITRDHTPHRCPKCKRKKRAFEFTHLAGQRLAWCKVCMADERNETTARNQAAEQRISSGIRERATR